MSKQLFINNFTISLVLFLWGFAGFFSHHWNTIPGPLHFQFLKLFGNLHILVKDAVLLVTDDLLDGLGIHPQHDAVGDKCLPGGMVGDQFIFGLRVFPLARISRFVRISSLSPDEHNLQFSCFAC